MRKADRLFQIILLLRHERLVTAAMLAEQLEVSERTIYRDIADLIQSGTPIDGEAGVGYRLRRGYQVPPLMFSEDEIAALVVGAKLATAWGDPALGQSARQALARIEAVLPKTLAQRVDSLGRRILAPDFHLPPERREPLAELREGLESSRKVHIHYRRADGAASERTLWPLGLVFWGHCWTLGAWCELRNEFRTFRVDRIDAVEVLPESFDDRHGHWWEEYLRRARSQSASDRDLCS